MAAGKQFLFAYAVPHKPLAGHPVGCNVPASLVLNHSMTNLAAPRPRLRPRGALLWLFFLAAFPATLPLPARAEAMRSYSVVFCIFAATHLRYASLKGTG